jgi:Bacterial Ig domain/von Willebrand factor type D domain/RTX calcium-binding nonapeptide repeat (4 copies)
VATLNGTSKDDVLFIAAGSSNDTILGLEGNDYLDATPGKGNNTLKGGNGDDELYAYANDQLFGEAGNDSLYSDGNGANTLSGGDGNDTLFADRNDIVSGDAGDDTIFGGSSGNKLTGGTGKDSFYITTNGVPVVPNEVLDFTQGDDKVIITAIPEVKTFADLIRVQTGPNTTLRTNIGGTVKDLGILRNVKADTLNRVDFNLGPALVNTAPVANPSKTLTLLEDAAPTPLGITAPTDVDGDPLTLVINAVPESAKGEVRLSDGTVVKTGTPLTLAQLATLAFTPIPDANGSAGTFSYTVSDGQGGTASQAIAINIAPVNDAPIANPDKTLTLLEDAAPTPLGITVPTDVDGDPLTLVVNSVPDGTKGQIRLSDGTVVKAGASLTLDQLTTLVFAPTRNANGSAGTFSYSVSDGKGGSASQTVTVQITPGGKGGSVGDPHIYTFDGFHYDFQASGDFVLVRALDSDLEVQVRQAPWTSNPGTTVNTGLATIVDGNRVEFSIDRPLPLIDNLPVFLEPGTSLALGKGSISRTAMSGYGLQGDLYTITYPNGDELKNAVFSGFLMDPTIDLANSRNVVGLLGNHNGNAEDDLALRDGTILANPLADENLYGAFSESWKVTANESIFSPLSLLGAEQTSAVASQTDLDGLAKRFVFGGNGDDILIGADNTLANPGKGKVDLFMGNKGADTFVLGDLNNPYYVGEGFQDYALITDLWAGDGIQLHGSASDYVLGIAPAGLANGTGIFLANDGNELIGIIQGETIGNLNLSNASIFHYV